MANDTTTSAYKLAKEAFVSNLNGGDVSEINLVTFVAPVCPCRIYETHSTRLTSVMKTSVFLWSALQSQNSLFKPYRLVSYLVDFLLNVAAILFATTLYSSQIILLNGLLLIPAISLLLTGRSSNSRYGKHSDKKSSPPTTATTPSNRSPTSLPIKPFITTYRGTMLVVTCVAILAVDFRVFPRRFAKVENWGTSLMDLGVGSFVFSAGTIAARPLLKTKSSASLSSLGSRLLAAGRHALPLLVLGLIRLFSVKGLDYAEHVTEYGVHWNFFFTLGFIPPLMALFDTLFVYVPSYSLLSLGLGVTYQVLLDSTGLTAFIITAPRTDLLSKNREGVFSFIGYLAIFLAGQATGMYVLPSYPSRNGQTWWKNPLLRRLVVWTTIWSGLYFLCTDYKYGAALRVSRRLANLPYVLWIAAFNVGQIGCFYGVERLCFSELGNDTITPDSTNKVSPATKEKDSSAAAAAAARASRQASRRFTVDDACSKILRAYNRNGLAIFLLANLLTGLVNMSLPTLYMSDIQAMGVLLGYMASLTGIAVVLEQWGVSVKL